MSPSEEQIKIIRAKAKIFVKRWNVMGKILKEQKDSQTFINEFFGVFGIDRQASNIFFE